MKDTELLLKFGKDLSKEQQIELIQTLEALSAVQRRKKFHQLFPDTGEFRRELYQKHLEFFEAGSKYRERLLIAGNRCFGEDTPVRLANGKYKPIEDIQIGDYVLAYDKIKKTAIPSKVIDTYRGTTNNFVKLSGKGQQPIFVTDDHKFLSISQRKVYRHLSVNQIVQTYNKAVLVDSVTLPTIDCSVSPDVARLIGYLLGDGSFVGDCVRFTNEREELHADIEQIVKREFGLTYTRYGSDAYMRVAGGVKGGNPLINLLRSWGLWKKKCHEKFIPEELLTASISHIQELYKGLIATDGSVNKRKVCFYNTSRQLVEDVQFVLLRLGCKSNWYTTEPENSNQRLAYTLQAAIYTEISTLPQVLTKEVYRTPLSRIAMQAVSVNIDYRISEELPCYCITVEHPDHLFIVGSYVVENCGKTVSGAFELTCHATGLYPSWWNGKRFARPINAWVGGDTTTSVRDIIQKELLGSIGEFGTGLLPGDCIKDTKPKRGVPDAVETILVRHISGGTSTIMLKTYEQGREMWQGTSQDVIWLDEEPPLDVYSEALLRTMTTGGTVYLTFTPLRGLSNVVLSFMENNQNVKEKTTKFMVTATWDDAPHLTTEMKEEMLSAIPPNERDARSKGIPVIGSGLIFPINEEKVIVEDFPIPRFWPRMYGIDVGWQKTAVVWGALDREADCLYIYSEHYAGEQEPVIHAKAIKSRGEHLKGVIDPASRGRNQIDGKNLFQLYTDEGLHLMPANNAVESGIYEMWDRFQTGRLKIFKTCQNLIGELKLYHRDDKGKIKKTRDHAIDACRYLVNSSIYSTSTTKLEYERKRNVIELKTAAWT